MSRFSQSDRVSIAALFILSLLESSAVLVHDLLPNLSSVAFPSLQYSALALGLFGLLAAIAATFRRHHWSFGPQLWLPIVAGLTLFAIPAALSAIAARSIPPLTIAALQTLAPLFCIILEPYLASSTASDSQPRYGILPALIAFSGVLLIFPVFVPSSYSVALALTAALAAAFSTGAGNCLAVRAAAADTSLAVTAATASISASLTLGLLSTIIEQPRFTAAMVDIENLWPLILQILALALLFWLARRITAPRLATRVIWALILPILIEIAFLPVPFTLRNGIGLALMACGAGALLLLRNPVSEQSSLSLR